MFCLDEAGVSGMDWDQKDNATKLTSKKEYDCVICSQSSPSTEDNPMGLVVLVQVIKFVQFYSYNFIFIDYLLNSI